MQGILLQDFHLGLRWDNHSNLGIIGKIFPHATVV